ncbi:hypothetical protein EK904_014577 [Melospiza melodia maxima]|nr:hypothetical protein EK904_014577 [Melospiza melodia maxima]
MSSFDTHPPAALSTVVSVSVVALEQLLTELEDFLRILDKENLSSTAVVKKSFLSDLLKVYTKSTGGDEEYIYMNKVTVHKQQGDQEKQDKVLDQKNSLTNGDSGLHLSPPQKSLPELPPPKVQCNTGWVETPLPVYDDEAKNPGRPTPIAWARGRRREVFKETEVVMTLSCCFGNLSWVILETKQPAVPKIESPEGYYEEAEPYDISVNELSSLISLGI